MSVFVIIVQTVVILFLWNRMSNWERLARRALEIAEMANRNSQSWKRNAKLWRQQAEEKQI